MTKKTVTHYRDNSGQFPEHPCAASTEDCMAYDAWGNVVEVGYWLNRIPHAAQAHKIVYTFNA